MLYNGIRKTIQEQTISLIDTSGLRIVGIYIDNNGKIGASTFEKNGFITDSPIILSFFIDDSNNITNPFLSCKKFIVDRKEIFDSRIEGINNNLNDIFKYLVGYYLGRIEVDTENNTIKSNGGILVFQKGERTSALNSTEETIEDDLTNQTGVIVYDVLNRTFKVFAANNTELVNNNKLIVIGSFIIKDEKYVGNIYEFILNGKPLGIYGALAEISELNQELNQKLNQELNQKLNQLANNLYKTENYGNIIPNNSAAWGGTFILNKIFNAGDRIVNVSTTLLDYIPTRLGVIILSEPVDGSSNVLFIQDMLNIPQNFGDITIPIDYTGTEKFMVGIFGYCNNSDDKDIFISQSVDNEYDVYRKKYADITNPTVGTSIELGSIFGFKVVIKVGLYEGTVNSSNLYDRVSKLENLNKGVNKLTLYDDVRDLSSNFNLLGFSSSDKKLVANNTENYACYNKRFISDQRKAQFTVKVPNKNGIIRVGALQLANVDGTISYSTCCEVNFTENKLKIYRGGGSNGITILNLLKEINITQDLENNSDFILELSRNRKITILRLINPFKQYVDEIIFDGNDTTFSAGAGNHRPFYFIYTNIQNTEFSRLTIFGAYDVDLAHIGDSLSESNGRADTGSSAGTNWIEQVMEEIDWNGSIVAQSGMDAEDAITALNNEIRYMKPKALSVMIGTNGGITDGQINQIKQFADDNNIPYIQHHIPMTEGREPSAGNSAQYIAEQLDRLEIIGARMDVATALNGNVEEGYNSDYFVGDKIHTNRLGNDSMKRQFFIDVPQFIFYKR